MVTFSFPSEMVENMKRVTSSEQESTVEGCRVEIESELAKICEDILDTPVTSSTSTSSRFSLSLQAGRRCSTTSCEFARLISLSVLTYLSF